ncbi:hypothetical protein BJV82DRAFT_619270 [Fennellomyces sp. T-0311]|nr:hypothetical protein BJV82DRAFT_619270 [Fennellomyces sp. T-0311]
MESDTTELASQLTQWTQRLNERKEALQSELQRLQVFRNDYDALEKTLSTLPDQTTRSAMIPIGKLAFMPGKLIHTNEITVYLGDQYYAERSAKQAFGILERRKEVVDENLRLIEAQINALQTKSEAGQGSIPASDLGVNEEGLPIVEIREELPEEKAPTAAESREVPSKPTAEPTAKTWTEKEHKDVMAMLQRLEEEEEEDELEQEIQKQKSSKGGAKEDEEDDDEEDWNCYDTEIADNLFDHFEDDEDYATQGIVDQVDATVYEEEDFQDPELDVQQTAEAVAKQQAPEIVTERPPPAIDESPLKERVAEKKPEPKATDAASETGAMPTPLKARKPSRFKVAKQKERMRPSTAAPVKKDDVDQPPKVEKQTTESNPPSLSSL